jgi:peptide/nickel transport system substrate-binding protein
MTRKMAAAVYERDAKKRAAIYEEVQREHQRISPFVIMYQEVEVAGRRKDVDGFVIGPNFGTNFYAGIRKN